MEKTLKILNELEKARLVSKYAIGGAIAVLFYTEPVLTYAWTSTVSCRSRVEGW